MFVGGQGRIVLPSQGREIKKRETSREQVQRVQGGRGVPRDPARGGENESCSPEFKAVVLRIGEGRDP